MKSFFRHTLDVRLSANPPGVSQIRTLKLFSVTLCAGLMALLIYPTTVRSAASAKQRIVVIRQQADKNSSRLIRGMKSEFKRSGNSLSLEVITVSELRNPNLELMDSLRSLRPNIVVPVGSHITEFISDSVRNVPIVFAAVFQPESSGFINQSGATSSSITGASLDISPTLQFKYFKQIYPGLKRLGIIYSDETAKLIPHAKIVAQAIGIDLRSVQVKSNPGRVSGREVKKALDSLLPIVDGLWSLADPTVFSPVATKLIIKRTLQKKIPLMGFSSTIVASGALFALDFDYKDIGRQAAELCRATLQRVDPAGIPVTTPDIVWFHYNQRTSNRIAIPIPEELRAVAKEVYK